MSLQARELTVGEVREFFRASEEIKAEILSVVATGAAVPDKLVAVSCGCTEEDLRKLPYQEYKRLAGEVLEANRVFFDDLAGMATGQDTETESGS